jgi:hypothetical protein
MGKAEQPEAPESKPVSKPDARELQAGSIRAESPRRTVPPCTTDA